MAHARRTVWLGVSGKLYQRGGRLGPLGGPELHCDGGGCRGTQDHRRWNHMDQAPRSLQSTGRGRIVVQEHP